jgi:hypothetical protein
LGRLLKSGAKVPSINFYIIVACTYLLTGGDSPVEFNTTNILRLQFADLKLSSQQSSQVLDSSAIGLHESMQGFERLKKLIANECDGHVGAFRITIDSLNTINKNKPFSSEEEAIAGFFYINLGATYARCWTFQINEELHQQLKSQITSILAGNEITYNADINASVKSIITAGVLQGSQE